VLKEQLQKGGRVLLCLDNLQRAGDASDLLPLDSLPAGSIVIVASRYADVVNTVLRRPGPPPAMPDLEDGEARELLLSEAGLSGAAADDLVAKALDKLRLSGGGFHPLATKVLGATLAEASNALDALDALGEVGSGGYKLVGDVFQVCEFANLQRCVDGVEPIAYPFPHATPDDGSVTNCTT
jgi:hypothetical protein